MRLSNIASEQLRSRNTFCNWFSVRFTAPALANGTVIVALFLFRPAMLLDLRKGVVLGHQDVRERFVVAQQHVVARFQLLDQVLLQQQRLGFRLAWSGTSSTPVCEIIRAIRAVCPSGGHSWTPALSSSAPCRRRAPPLRIEHPVHPRRAIQRAQIPRDTLVSGHSLFAGIGVDGHGPPDSIARCI